MPRPTLKTGTNNNSVADKLAELKNDSANLAMNVNEEDATQNSDKEGGTKEKSISPSAIERIRIMQQHHLRKDMVLIGGEIEYSESEIFIKILNAYKAEDRYKDKKDRMGWNQKTLAAHYLREAIKKDQKKFDIK